jgi:vancomycin resistance protein YoaR
MSTASQSLPESVFPLRGSRVSVAAFAIAFARWARVLAIAVAIFLAAAAVGFALYGYSHTGRFYEGVSIAGVEVGGLTKAEARVEVLNSFGAYVRTPVTLEAGGQHYKLDLRDANTAVDLDATIAEAYGFGRGGSWWSRTQDWARAVIHGHDSRVAVNVDTQRLDDAIAALAPSVTKAAVDASIDFSAESGPVINPDIPGIALDVTTTRESVLALLAEMSYQPVQMTTPAVAASVTAESLQPSLANANQVVSVPLVVEAIGKQWGVTTEDLKRIASIGTDGSVSINRNAIDSLVKNIAAEIERPARNAEVQIKESGDIVAVPGEQSVAVDLEASAAAIEQVLESGGHDASLVVTRTAPKISDAQAETAAVRAEKMIAAGVTLRWSGGEVELGQADLAAALRVAADPNKADPFTVGFDSDALAWVLNPIADEINVEPKNASFRMIDGKIKAVDKGTNGQRLDLNLAVSEIEAAVGGDGPREVELSVVAVKPEIGEKDASKIKVPDLLADSSTWYGESSDARRNNVEVAAKLEDGWLIPPGGQFSYAQYVGMVTEAEGFVTGFGIVASPEGDGSVTTAPVIGGGICQVSTTIFQAAFWAGLQIDERYEHPYWMQTYGQPPRGMKGLDAMVNIEETGTLDMKFTNTTGSWIAVVVKADGENVTAQIYGKDPGWDIEVSDPVISDVVEADPEMYYTESSEIPSGTELQVEHAAEGFSSSIHRVVKDKDGNVVDDYTVSSWYAASRNTTLRGTGPAE